jgi:uncharacterized protein (TIGR02246 family)
MTKNFVIAECAIRQLHARVIDAAWRRDGDAYAACFAEDGEWKIATMHIRGRDAIGETFARLLGYCKRVHFIVSLPLLDIGEGAATGRVPVTEFAWMPDGSSAMTIGIYYDHYVEEGGEWLFRKRHFGLQHRSPMDLSGPFVDCPDYGPPPGMPGPDEPTFTFRKAVD